ncbi:MAG TPA: amino acid ABC transporter ATP-binding protein [Pseudonocardia sp.]|nr:amino acid ABC transporter ATP-binding protein [Pseudonocardia sp.]
MLKSYGGQRILKGVDLELRRGEVACIIGPSGSGKSTLLRTINHLEPLDGGDIHVEGSIVGYRERRGKLVEMSAREAAHSRVGIGMVFQSFNLFPLTVLRNVVAAPVYVGKRTRADAEREATALLTRVGLADKTSAYPGMLSGGQQQRVAIARALAMRPSLMLFDEPTSALDPELVGEVLAVIRELAQTGMSMVIVTNEIAFAREVADLVIMMDYGAIVEQGTPAQVLGQPRHPRTQGFLAKIL